jgi:surface protein
MFYGCRTLREIPMFDIVSTGLRSFTSVFQECEMVKALPFIDTSTANTFINFALNCYNLEKIHEYDTRNATTFSSTFYACRSITSVPLLDTSNATSFSNMFNSCTALKRVPQLDTSNATSMTGMFNGCVGLESVPWMDTSNVERFDYMFSNCFSLRTVPLYDMSSARTLRDMFAFCFSLQDLPDLDTSNIANDPLDAFAFQRIFRGCVMLKKIPASFFNGIAGARNIDRLFENCLQLRTIPDTFSNLNTNPSYQVSVYDYAFWTCVSLRKIPAFAFGSAATSTSNMFGDSGTSGRLFSLESVVINNLNQTTYIRGTMMNREALIALFNGLATVSAKTLDITGCPGAGQIDATDIAIATGKGWTLTL